MPRLLAAPATRPTVLHAPAKLDTILWYLYCLAASCVETCLAIDEARPVAWHLLTISSCLIEEEVKNNSLPFDSHSKPGLQTCSRIARNVQVHATWFLRVLYGGRS